MNRLLRRIGRLLIYSFAALLLLFAVLLIKMALTPSRQAGLFSGATATVTLPPEAEQLKMAERLAQALRIATVSNEGLPPSPEALRALQMHLQAAFPTVHTALQRELVNDYSLLYTWKGDEGRKPYVLLAHQDVVPVEPGSESRWHQPPFSGAISDGYVWGRGALDDKFSLMAIFEAIERLLHSGYKPHRTVYLAFGHDEEVAGKFGAVRMAALLQQRGIRAEFVIDEGQAVTQGILPGLDRKVALIGLAEKGYLSVELIAKAAGGHSSMPPAHTAVGVLSQAITRLEGSQMPKTLRGPTGKLFSYLGPEMALPLRLVMTNLWLLKPVILYQLAQGPTTNSIIRTTTAPTMFEGSPKDNVLPQRARAVVNFRLLPGDSSAAVLQHIRDVIADPAVEVHAIADTLSEASPESSDTVPAFAVIAKSIHAVYPDALIAPSLNGGASDARHYSQVADDSYRFMPALIRPEDLSRFHGTDERIAIDVYARCVAFYEELIRNADAAP